MKKLLFIAAAFIVSAGAMAQKTMVNDFAKFNVERYDFGKVKQNVPAVYSFEITNTSDKPLVIENAHATCGCTVPEWQKEPIAPGKTTKIKVQYNAANGGHFDKAVYVKFAGVDEEKTLGITGEVLAADAFDVWAKEDAAAKAAAAEKAAAEKAAAEKTTKSKNKGKNKSGK
ncbi:MAG TPA: DUF1573 domain-containing protein [Chitinophagaceae bacterium]|jgi:hypothetical protein|nr:DUF1573 domain-containing protein [Chitinophagaceae bacterium]